MKCFIVTFLFFTRAVAKTNDQDYKGMTLFHLQDRDGSCLQITGALGPCTESSYFMYAPRMKGGKSEGHSLVALHSPSPGASCLSRASASKVTSALAAGSCGASGAKQFDLVLDKGSGSHFVSALKSTSCVVRTAHTTEVRNRQAAARKRNKPDPFDARYLYNGVSMQPCKDGGTLLQVVESGVHDLGFWITTADGQCFDGFTFRRCDPSSASLVWGWGIKFTGKGDTRYLYKWHTPTQCLSREGGATALASCDSPGDWRLSTRGELTSEKFCVVRSLYNEARMVKCSGPTNHLFEALSIASRR